MIVRKNRALVTGEKNLIGDNGFTEVQLAEIADCGYSIKIQNGWNDE